MLRSLTHVLATLALAAGAAQAAPALTVLGRDYTFAHRLKDLPATLADFKGLQVNNFTTNDGVMLSYWEAGQGEPIIFIPGWSASVEACSGRTSRWQCVYADQAQDSALTCQQVTLGDSRTV